MRVPDRGHGGAALNSRPEADPATVRAPAALQRTGDGVRTRAEDWLLAAVVAVLGPWLIRGHASTGGPFDAGSPGAGWLGILAILGAAICIASRPSSSAIRPGLLASAAVGPLIGGLLLVAIGTAAALGLTGGAGVVIGAGVVAVAVAARLWLPAPSSLVRRALVTPYVLVAASRFWSSVAAVTDGGDLTAAIRQAAAGGIGPALPAVAFLAAFTAVFYAMLVFAPRQVAEREGNAATWLVRYLVFLASVLLGASWLLLLGP